MKKLNQTYLFSCIICFCSLLFSPSLLAQTKVTRTFNVTIPLLKKGEIQETKVGIRGDVPPLSWEKDYPLTYSEKDGTYQATITFEPTASKQTLNYKFVYGEKPTWELIGDENRNLVLNEETKTLPTHFWNEYLAFTTEELKKQTVSKAELLEDYEIMKKAYLSLHPGLYRYNTKASLEQHLETLKNSFYDDMPLTEVYKVFSIFLQKIKCGHTYANFWNQPKVVKKAIHFQPNKLPFYFRWIDQKIIITHSTNSNLPKGTVINAINGISTTEILNTLLDIAKTDGSNIKRQISDLELQSIDKYKSFDIYFPLYYAPKNGNFELTTINSQTKKEENVMVKAVTPNQRSAALSAKFPNLEKTDAELWEFNLIDEQTAHLSIGTFVTWHMDMDWKKFLKDVFQTIKDKKIQNLILDIRGNGGGMDDVSAEIGKYLVTKDFTIEGRRTLVAYEKVPKDLNPYLKTWDDKYRDFSKKIVPYKDGLYKWKAKDGAPSKIKATKNPLLFTGKTYLLVNAANSSATFYLAKLFKVGKIGTVVGQTTGGNQKGINGGAMFFLNLPNSKVEMDIPLFAGFPLTEKPDAGIDPDVYIQPNIEDIANGVDTELEAVKQMIKNAQQSSSN